MNTIIAYPTDDGIFVGLCGDDFKDCNHLTIDYPTSHSEFESAIKKVMTEMGNPEFDVGIACYGMTEKTDNPAHTLTEETVKELAECKHGTDFSNMTSVLIHALNPKKAILAYPLTYDCLPPVAKLSGIPQIERRMVAHTMDHLIAGKGKRVLTVYLSKGEISVCAQDKGEVIDITNSYDGEGPMTPTRSGFFQQRCIYKMAFSDKYDQDELLEKIRFKGGLFAHLGTSELDDVYSMIDDGDDKAKLIYDAMLYTIFKEIGSKSAWLEGNFEGIILTGDLSKNDRFVGDIKKGISKLSDVSVNTEFCIGTFLKEKGIL